MFPRYGKAYNSAGAERMSVTGGVTKRMGFVLLQDGALSICANKQSRNEKERKNKMYKQVSPNLNFVEREKTVEQFWKDNNIFEKSIFRDFICIFCYYCLL